VTGDRHDEIAARLREEAAARERALEIIRENELRKLR